MTMDKKRAGVKPDTQVYDMFLAGMEEER